MMRLPSYLIAYETHPSRGNLALATSRSVCWTATHILAAEDTEHRVSIDAWRGSKNGLGFCEGSPFNYEPIEEGSG